MDSNEIVNQARSRFEHEAARRVLRERYEAAMIFAHSGGMWRAGPELQSTLLTCSEPHAVLADLYSNPVRVDVKQLMVMSQTRWQEQMTAWLVEYEDLSRCR